MSERPTETSGAVPLPGDGASAGPPSNGASGEARRGIPRRRGALAWLALIVVVLVASAAASPWWAPILVPLLPWSNIVAPVEAPAGTANTADAAKPRLAALEQRLTETEQRLAQLGRRDGSGAAAGGDTLTPLRDAVERQSGTIADFGNRIAALEKQLAARPAAEPAALGELQSAVGKLGAAVAELDARVTKLAASRETTGSRTIQALLLSLGQLRQSLQGSGPFDAELTAATTLARDRPDVKSALAPLAEVAPGGLPSLAILRQRFDGLAGRIADAGVQPAAADDWGSQVLGRLRALVTVRRVGAGPAGSTGPDATVATAESALGGDDLAGAVAVLETLHGPAMLAAREWLDAAQRRLAAEAALDKATALVTTELAAEQAPQAAGAKP